MLSIRRSILTLFALAGGWILCTQVLTQAPGYLIARSTGNSQTNLQEQITQNEGALKSLQTKEKTLIQATQTAQEQISLLTENYTTHLNQLAKEGLITLTNDNE